MDDRTLLTMMLAGALTLGSLEAVTVDDAGLGAADPAVAFVVRDLERIMKDVSLKVRLREDRCLESQRWHLKTDGGVLTISGRDGMGIAYGVFSFLEKFVGCAWYADDTEVIPDLSSWTVPAIDETGRPSFLTREMYVGADYMDLDWRLRNKETQRAACGVGVFCGAPGDCHTFGAYARALEAAHPECFTSDRLAASENPCRDLCMTDRTTREFVADEMCRHIERDAAATAGRPPYRLPRIYELSQNDGPSWGECRCAACQRIAEEEGGYAGPNIAFVNAVADRVRQRHPEVAVRTFAYSYTEDAPRKIVASDNVIVRYCRSWLFNPLLAGTKQGDGLVEWGRHASKIEVWSYWRTYSGNLYPFVMSPSRIAKELRFCRANKVTGYFAEDEAPLSRSFAMLQHWLFLKLAEDPERDYKNLTTNFLRAYYGAAARPMAEYLGFLSRTQEESLAYLNRGFFERANALLDQAEVLSQNDVRSLRHVRWERIVVDRAMYERMGALAAEGYAFDRRKVLERFARNTREQLMNWKEFQNDDHLAMRDSRMKQVSDEAKLYAHYPVELPERFHGLEVDDRQWTQCAPSSAAFVSDPEACAGTAFFNPKRPAKLPFSFGYYNVANKEGDSVFFGTREDVPQDEKFHLYRVGKAYITSPIALHFDDSWHFMRNPSGIGIVPERRDVWYSAKFQGPAFVSGSTNRNAVLFDRVLFVKDDNPLRQYERPNPSFKLFARSEFHARGEADDYAYDAEPLAAVAEIKCDLLVRGSFRYVGVEAGKGMSLPFVGLWALTKDSGNSFTIPCATFYIGDYDWRPFEAVIEADRLRRYVARVPEKDRPLSLYFRLNLCRQPGEVWLKDVEVIPLKRKIQ